MAELAEMKGTFKGLVWGFLLAVATLILLESEKGSKLKAKLKEHGDELLDRLPDLLDDLEEKSEGWIKEAGKLEDKIVGKAVELESELKEVSGRKSGASLGHINAIQEHGRQLTTGLKKRLFKNIPRKSPS